jgi:maleylacetate reductase
VKRIWIAGSYQYPTMESVIYGKSAAEALREEAERLNAKRIYLIVSRTLNTKTDEIDKIRKALGDRHAETFDGIPQHTTREVVVKTAKRAKESKADLVVAIGGGSVVDAAKIVLMCMEHEIFEQDGLDGFETTPERRFGHFRTPKVRMIAIPSTLSGGEYNSGTLVTDTRRKLKQIFNHPMMMPSSIILDPAITKYTPEKLWLGSGTRAMDHGIEAICSSRPNVLVDTVCQQGLRYLHVMPSVLRYNRPATEAAQKSIAARHVPIGSPSALATSATPWL